MWWLTVMRDLLCGLWAAVLLGLALAPWMVSWRVARVLWGAALAGWGAVSGAWWLGMVVHAVAGVGPALLGAWPWVSSQAPWWFVLASIPAPLCGSWMLWPERPAAPVGSRGRRPRHVL